MASGGASGSVEEALGRVKDYKPDRQNDLKQITSDLNLIFSNLDAWLSGESFDDVLEAIELENQLLKNILDKQVLELNKQITELKRRNPPEKAEKYEKQLGMVMDLIKSMREQEMNLRRQLLALKRKSEDSPRQSSKRPKPGPALALRIV